MDKQKREKRAQAIAAMGLVKPVAEGFTVCTPSLRGRLNPSQVNFRKRYTCTCLEFAEYARTEPDFECEHILAAKIFLTKGK